MKNVSSGGGNSKIPWQPLAGGGGCCSRLATGIPLRFRVCERGSEGARCNLVAIVKFSVLTLAAVIARDVVIVISVTELIEQPHAIPDPRKGKHKTEHVLVH